MILIGLLFATGLFISYFHREVNLSNTKKQMQEMTVGYLVQNYKKTSEKYLLTERLEDFSGDDPSRKILVLPRDKYWALMSKYAILIVIFCLAACLALFYMATPIKTTDVANCSFLSILMSFCMVTLTCMAIESRFLEIGDKRRMDYLVRIERKHRGSAKQTY